MLLIENALAMAVGCGPTGGAVVGTTTAAASSVESDSDSPDSEPSSVSLAVGVAVSAGASAVAVGCGVSVAITISVGVGIFVGRLVGVATNAVEDAVGTTDGSAATLGELVCEAGSASPNRPNSLGDSQSNSTAKATINTMPTSRKIRPTFLPIIFVSGTTS